jgi:hypothetical protein
VCYTHNTDVRKTLIHLLPTVQRMDMADETAYTRMIFSQTCPSVMGKNLKFLWGKNVLNICNKGESKAYTEPRDKFCGTR